MTGLGVFRGRRVFLTGHTGFKGSWLSLWLSQLGAEVHGYSLIPATTPNLFTEAGIESNLASHTIGDVCDWQSLNAAMAKANPEMVFHMAAQAIVRRSYREPRQTWETNVLGTVNVLEAVRARPDIRVCQVITSDKCYENPGQVCAFRETDAMGGHDPYSSSKGAAEIAVASWRRSFFDSAKTSISSARAGNVIGGGDWADDRLIPDCIRALSAGQVIAVRNPFAVRPWQHVLEPLSGYLSLASAQWSEPKPFADAFNFGPLPSGNLDVAKVTDAVVKHWGGGRWEPTNDTTTRDQLHEARFLKLDITKATTLLPWKPALSAEESIEHTVTWYRRRHAEGAKFDARAMCLAQIADYSRRAE